MFWDFGSNNLNTKTAVSKLSGRRNSCIQGKLNTPSMAHFGTHDAIFSFPFGSFLIAKNLFASDLTYGDLRNTGLFMESLNDASRHPE
jgi:hypothetical protein